MGECTLKPRFSDFGERQHILDIAPPFVRFDTAEESDPGATINGGSGIPTLTPELKK